jgi:hypothetical protein
MATTANKKVKAKMPKTQINAQSMQLSTNPPMEPNMWRSHISGPMAIFVNSQGLPQYIADTQVNTYLQKVAKDVYKITDPIELARWTCHSIRFGACVTLFNQHKNESFIMFQLRWQSNSWKVYIHDSPHLSEAHIQAFNDSWPKQHQNQNNQDQKYYNLNN